MHSVAENELREWFVATVVQRGLLVETDRNGAHSRPSRPAAVAGSILGYGRWRLSFRGQGNHAGTTLMDNRADPMVAAAQAVVEVRKIAAARRGARHCRGRGLFRVPDRGVAEPHRPLRHWPAVGADDSAG